MRKTSKSYRKVCANVYQLSSGTYRSRILVGGKKFENYETNLTRAKAWVKGMKTGKLS